MQEIVYKAQALTAGKRNSGISVCWSFSFLCIFIVRWKIPVANPELRLPAKRYATPYDDTANNKIWVRKKDLYILTTIISVNLLTYFLLLPYAQKTANSHMDNGPFFGTIFYFVAGLLSFVGLIHVVRQKDYKLFLLLIVFASTLTFWGFRLHSLLCLGCLNSG